jgi:hypothetical protein
MVGSAFGTIVCLLALIARQIHDKAARAEFMFATVCSPFLCGRTTLIDMPTGASGAYG